MDVNEELLICSLYTYKFIVCSFIVCSFSKQELIAFKWWVFYFKPWDTKHSLLPCRLLIRLTCSGGRKPVWKIQIRFENLEQRCKKKRDDTYGHWFEVHKSNMEVAHFQYPVKYGVTTMYCTNCHHFTRKSYLTLKIQISELSL